MHVIYRYFTGSSLMTLGVAFLLCACLAAQDAPKIKLNSIGYLPGKEKKASITAACSQFFVTRVKDGKKVFEGRTTGPVVNADTKEEIWTADFSKLKKPGEYRLEAPCAGTSAPFRIGDDIYDLPFKTVTRAMYLWRCGTAVKGEYNGRTFGHEACHLEDAWMDAVTGDHVRVDGVGGWHDAGDYNKYVVNAGITVGAMFRAWEEFGPGIRQIQLDIPKDEKSMPDYLAELQWEMDWLLKMQAEDGSVYHKISTRSFGGFIPPEEEKEDRLFVPWGSAATADFVAMTAMAARNFMPYDAALARRYLEAAKKSYAFLQSHPEDHQADQRGFRTGGYITTDPDDRLWAAAELWETTGDAVVLRDLETRVSSLEKLSERFDWPDVSAMGLFTYLASKRRGRDSVVTGKARGLILRTADFIVAERNRHGYGRPLGEYYNWGANGVIARQVMILLAANRLKPQATYIDTSLDALNHLFGRNVYGRSFVTGLGYRPPLHPHDRRFKIDAGAPWPGYLVGGPNPGAADWHDEWKDFRTNETAINWNAALIYALAAFIDKSGVPGAR